MPVVAIESYARLQLTFQTGTDGEGNPITKSRTYGSVKATATNDELYSVSQAFASLSQYPLVQVEKLGSAEILNQ